MKTSHILLAIITFLTLTGMVATNVLLTQQYEKIDWSDPFQDFERRALPTARHWVINGFPGAEIIVEKGKGTQAQALVRPDMLNLYSARQQGDTVFVTFAPNVSLPGNSHDTDYELSTGLLLRVPDLQSLRVRDSRLTLRNYARPGLVVSLQMSRLRTDKLTVANAMDVRVSQNSVAILGADTYKSLRVVVQDSSGLQLNNTQTETFALEVSPKADVQLRGRALRWLK
jgi:hypothetical protein